MSHKHPTLTLTPSEMCSTIDALRSTMCNRLRWAITPNHPFKTNDFIDVQMVIGELVAIYAKAMMAAKDTDVVATSFFDYFTLTPEIWEVLDIISLAKDWSAMPSHPEGHQCELCRQLADIH